MMNFKEAQCMVLGKCWHSKYLIALKRKSEFNRFKHFAHILWNLNLQGGPSIDEQLYKLRTFRHEMFAGFDKVSKRLLWRRRCMN